MRKIMSFVLAIFVFASFSVLASCNTATEPTSTETSQEPKLEPKEKLRKFIIETGQKSGNLHYISLQGSDFVTHFLVYDSSLDQICFEYYDADKYLDKPQTNNTNISFSVKINCDTDVVLCYSNTENNAIYQGSGKLDKRHFGDSILSQLTDMNITGKDTFTAGLVKETFSYRAHMMLLYLNSKLKEWNLGISLKDLGYIHF